ncbi:MAG: MBL fold metallo-hydrolase [Syntrophobacterales bacterium]|nr:MBL fold metallo-hydrolase [Syntrophobacterales bacterium]
MELSVIASGSNGNCYLLEESGASVLIDAGIGLHETAQRLAALGKDIRQVNGIVLSHAHSDHYQGIGPLARNLDIPVYADQEVYNSCRERLGKVEIHHFQGCFRINGMEITPVETSHDVASFGFVVGGLGIFTDTGRVTGGMKEAMGKLKVVVLESNYDEEMLFHGPYPAHLKVRIASDRGHLSNDDASDFISRYGTHLSLVLLAHLSEKNNTAARAKEAFESLNEGRRYVVCSRLRQTGTYRINEED